MSSRTSIHRAAEPSSPGESHGAATSAESTTTQRWRSTVPMLAAGGVSIVAGGLVAAVAGPTDWDHGSWVAAFLVLVAGVAQIGVGAAQAQLAPVAPTVGFAAVACVLWNAGCMTIVTGTLLSNQVAVSIGSTLLAAALAMSTFALRGSGIQPRQFLLPYRVLLLVLLTSTPIGIALAWTRH